MRVDFKGGEVTSDAGLLLIPGGGLAAGFDRASGPVRSMPASTPGPSSSYWSNGFAITGLIPGSSGVVTADSAGTGYSLGASATRFTI